MTVFGAAGFGVFGEGWRGDFTVFGGVAGIFGDVWGSMIFPTPLGMSCPLTLIFIWDVFAVLLAGIVGGVLGVAGTLAKGGNN